MPKKMLSVVVVLLALMGVTLVQAQDVIRIGYVSPQTGPLAPFGAADAFIVAGVEAAIADGLEINGTTYSVEILVRDTQSDPNRAAEVAADLILVDGVDMILVAATPETTNPVSDQCEVFQIPCVSTISPWQAWYFRSPESLQPDFAGYEYTYHYFWGLEDVISVFTSIWSSADTNMVVGAMWPNDGDGIAWSDPVLGFPPALEAAGFTVVDPGRYENLKDDFSAEIALFKENNVQIVTGVMLPPDLGTFLTQASQQGFNPIMVTVAKAALFPTVVETISDGLGENITTEIWWTPDHPYSSSLLGLTSAELGAAYTEATGNQETQPIGYVHSLFEVGIDVLRTAEDPKDAQSLLASIADTDLETIVGRVAWDMEGVPPHVTKTPLVGGQWITGENYPFELSIIVNPDESNGIPVGGELALMDWN
ncbi:MAG: ABC transporter substrate-binding protein [Phototrophicaceae bacterium]